MGDVKISVNEAEALTVVQDYDLRLLLRRLRPHSLERHRVVKWSSCACTSVEDAKFNRGLKFLFLIILIMGVISVIIYEDLLTHGSSLAKPSTWGHTFNQMWLFGYFQMGQTGIALLAMFAAFLAGSVLVNTAMRSAGSPAPRRESLQTISARVQQVNLNTT